MAVLSCLNSTELIGIVGRDPEVRTSATGLMALFSLATHEPFKSHDGQWQERTEWHHIVVFGSNAEIVRDHIRKGMRVSARGKIKTRTWKHAKYSDVTCSRTEIIANLISPLLTISTQTSQPTSKPAPSVPSPVLSNSDAEYTNSEYEVDPLPF